MMTIRLTYNLEHDEFVAALQAVVGSIKSSAEKREGMRRFGSFPYLHILVFLVFGLVGVLEILFFPERWVSILAITAGFVSVYAGIIKIINWYFSRTEPARLGVTYDARRHQGVTAVFDEEGAHYLGREHRQTWQWSLFQRFHELPSVYVLEFVGYDMLVVPRRAFSSTAQASSWAADIRGRLPTRV